MNKLTFGRYSPKNTFIHKMDPRNKIVARINFIDLFKSMATMWILIVVLFAAYIFIPMSTYSHVAF